MIVRQESQPVTADIVCKDLLERILSLKLEPGTEVSEDRICAYYGASPSVIQTVFSQLCKMRLLEIVPSGKACVSRMDLELITNTLLLRAAIEKEALFDLFEFKDLEQRQKVAEQLKANLSQQRQYLHSSTYEPEFQLLDSRYHDLLIDSAGCRGLMGLTEEPFIHITRWRNFDVTFERKVPELVRQHVAIYRAICDNDLIAALRTMSDHLDTVSKTYQRANTVYPHYFA